MITQAEVSLIFTPLSAEEAACNQISCLGIVFVGSKEVSMDYLSQPETGHTISVLSYKYKSYMLEQEPKGQTGVVQR